MMTDPDNTAEVLRYVTAQINDAIGIANGLLADGAHPAIIGNAFASIDEMLWEREVVVTALLYSDFTDEALWAWMDDETGEGV